MLEKRDQWLRHLGSPWVRGEVESCLQRIVDAGVDNLREAASRAGLPIRESREGWHDLAKELLTNDDKWRKKSALAQSLAGNEHLLECFKQFRNLPPAQFSDAQWLAMEAIVTLLPIAVGNLNAVFREHGTVDFIELTLASLRALADSEGPSDLGLALGYRIEHILLDEFQDTSYTQFELLERLTQTWDSGDGRTLFLVGDPMQSIYRFRQAEVGLFLRAWQSGIGNIALEPLTLSVNFRSGRGIVDWVNRTFRGVFPQQEDPVHGAVAYSESEASDADHAAAIDVHAFAGENSRTDEAERVANIAFEAHGTLGILVRARSHLPAIVAALKARGIRYQAIEIDDLGKRAIIQDLMALTFALLHPADRISQLAVLRAPWSGLTLEHLLQPGARHERVSLTLAQAIGERGRHSLRDLVEQTWIRLGGPACITADSDLADAQAYFDLLEGVDEGGDVSDFEVLRDRVDDLFAQPDSTAGDHVQIMTIHKAKGLEFDTVILPGLGAQPKKDEGQLILWHEPSASELLFAPITETGNEETDGIYRYLSRVEQQKSDYESIRLLYVAATRARTNLHLLGCANVKVDGSLTASGGSFLRILWPAVEPQFAALKPSVPAPIHNDGVWEPRLLRRLPAQWQPPAPPAAVEWLRREAPASDLPEISYEWVGDTLRHVGTTVHTYLTRIVREGLDHWSAAAIHSRQPAIRTMLMNLGVSNSELDGASRQVITALLHAITDDRGRWVLQNHPESECELAIAGVSEGRIYEAVIDRTFIDESGTRWIVDYKTSSHGGGGVEQFMANEKERYREQLERYARLVAQRDGRPVKLGLYFPLVSPGWIEWESPVVLRRQASLFSD